MDVRRVLENFEECAKAVRAENSMDLRGCSEFDVMLDALRAVLDIHTPLAVAASASTHGPTTYALTCPRCSPAGLPTYPCPTVAAITEALT